MYHNQGIAATYAIVGLITVATIPKSTADNRSVLNCFLRPKGYGGGVLIPYATNCSWCFMAPF